MNRFHNKNQLAAYLCALNVYRIIWPLLFAFSLLFVAWAHTSAPLQTPFAKTGITVRSTTFEASQQLASKSALAQVLCLGAVRTHPAKSTPGKLYAATILFLFGSSYNALLKKVALLLSSAYIRHLYPTHTFW